MEKCIDSLLVEERMWKSLWWMTDLQTEPQRSQTYMQEKYPTIVKAIHQENGGHGEAVNAGIRNATGLYFKVVDSDDWVNAEAYAQILKTLEELIRGSETVDLLISNFVYEKKAPSVKRL